MKDCFLRTAWNRLSEVSRHAAHLGMFAWGVLFWGVMIWGGLLSAQNPAPVPAEAATDTIPADTSAEGTTVSDSLVQVQEDSVNLQALRRQADSLLDAPSDVPEPEDVPPFRDSTVATPYHTIYHFLYFLQREHFDPRLAALSLNISGYSQNEKEKLAVKLKKIIDARVYIILEELPRDPNYVDTTSGRHKYVLTKDLPQVYLTRTGEQWLFSRHTLRAVPELYDQLYPAGSELLVEIVPSSIRHEKVLGLEVWQITGILIILLISLGLYVLLTWLARYLVKGVFVRFGISDLTREYLLPVARPISAWLMLLIVYLYVPALLLPIKVNEWVVFAFKVVTPIVGILILTRFIDLFSYVFTVVAQRSTSKWDDKLVPLVPIIKNITKTLVVIIGTVFVIQNLNYDITTLLAGLSIGGLAFALAAQDTIKNFFGSIMIILDRPFSIGDWVKFGDVEGIVERVDLRSTRIRTFYNSLVYVPNGMLADITVDNYGLRVYRRYYTTLGVMYDTPPELLETYVQGLRAIVASHPKSVSDRYEIHFHGYGDSSLNIMFYIFFEVASWAEELAARHEVNLACLRLAHQLGINFAFPTQTLHIENFPGQASMSPEYPLSPAEAQTVVENFTQTWRRNWTESWRKYEAQLPVSGPRPGSSEDGGGG